jgi:hypothetical protein
MWQRSRDHLVEAGEGYWQHLRFAMMVGLLAIAAGLACMIHALIPALCQRTCSRTISQLHQLFSSRDQWRDVQQEGSGALVFVMLMMLAGTTSFLPLIGGAPSVVTILVGGLAFSIPATFLLTNPDLEAVTD